MWKYEKRLQYPVKISQPNPKLAQFIVSQYGGPDGEMGASMRYLSQRFAMPYKIAKGALTDIGREASEMFHSEASAFFAQCSGDLQRIFPRRYLCNCIAPFHGKQIQIYNNVVLVDYNHFI